MRSFAQVEEVGKKLNWDRKQEQKGLNISEKLLGGEISSCIWDKNYMKHIVENTTFANESILSSQLAKSSSPGINWTSAECIVIWELALK